MRNGTFSYAGNRYIERIELVNARALLNDANLTEIEVKSTNVLESKEAYDLPLDFGRLAYARFKFYVRPDESRRAAVVFEIEPPSRTDLTQKRYAEIIEDYLLQEGVKLK